MEIQVLPSLKLICQHVPGSHSKWGRITLRLWVILPSPVFPGAGCFKVKHIGWQGSNPSEAHCAICRATISSVVRLRVWQPRHEDICATLCGQCSLWWWRKDIWWYRATRILVAITAKWCMIPYFNGPEFWCVRTCLTSKVTLLIFLIFLRQLLQFPRDLGKQQKLINLRPMKRNWMLWLAMDFQTINMTKTGELLEFIWHLWVSLLLRAPDSM